MEIIHKATDDLLQELSLNNLEQDINKCSRNFYASLLSISDFNHGETVKNIISMLMVSDNESARIVLYNILKYVDLSSLNASALNDLHFLLLSKIDLRKVETKHVLMGLQSLYKEQEFHAESYNNIMIMMRKLFYSPLQEVQVAAEKTITVIISGLSDDDISTELMKFLHSINWDSHNYFVVAKLIDKYSGILQEEFYNVAVKQVFRGLPSNFSSHSASVLFTALINKSDFEVFNRHIFPVLVGYLKEKDVSNRTLSCSIIKYILPACSDKYRLDFYEICTCLPNLKHSYLLNLISYNYLKFSIPKSKYVMKMVKTCIKMDDDLNFQIAFGILCRYNKLNSVVLESEFAFIKSFLKKIRNYECSFIINVQYFVSHLSVTLNDLENDSLYERYLQFFMWLYLLCLVKLGENCEESAKVFGNIFYVVVHILTGSSQQLKLSYNLPKSKHFNAFENPAYLALIKRNEFYFTWEYTIHKFLAEFINRDYYVPVISKIISNYMLDKIDRPSIIKLENNLDALSFTSNCYAGNRSLYCIDIILKYCGGDEIKCKELFQKMTSLVHLQFTQIMSGNMSKKFENFPLFIVIQCILNIIHCIHVENDVYLLLFAEIQNVLCYILENVDVNEKEALFLESKSNKAVEHSIIMCLDIMYALLTKMEFQKNSCKNMLEVLEKVITDSNMKRPVSHAAVKLEQLLRNTPQYRELYMAFYSRQENCFNNNSRRNTKIRRKPGTRLILHTLLRGIENLKFLNDAVHFLIQSAHSDILDSVTAALHTLESLVSDSNFKSKIAVYIPELLNLSLENLDSPDFAVKNASMQLFHAVTTRLLGQKSEEGRRPLSAVEIFLVYPDIREIMLGKLFTRNSGEDISKIAILSFLSESDYDKCMHSETRALDFNGLKSLFCYPDIARFAVKAYVAVCPSDEIFYSIIRDVKFLSVEKLSTNETFYRICAIEQLYKRFLLCYPDHENAHILNDAVAHNTFAINTNLFKLNSLNVYSESSLIFILNNAPPSKFSKYLSICFKQNFSEIFLYECLDAVIAKCKNAKYKNVIVISDLIVILINFLTTLNKPSASLIVGFYKVVMLLFDLQNNFRHSLNKLVKLEKCICKHDLYTQHVWLVVYGYKSKLNDDERGSISKTTSNLIEISETGKPDECYQVSAMLKDLFVLLEAKDKIIFLYLLIVLIIQLEETNEIDEFFLYLIGRFMPLRGRIKWLFTTGRTVFLTDTNSVRLFSSKLFKFISGYNLMETRDDNFYSKSYLVTEKLSFVVYVLSLLCEMYKEIVNLIN